MPGIDELLGANGVITQLLMWNVVSQVVTSLMSPAFNALQQDVLDKHPNAVITPDILARAVAQTFMDKAAAVAEAKKSGVDEQRFDILLKLADIRLSPADLAEAVLRSYETDERAKAEARLQGITPDRFDTLKLLAGDAIGPQQAAEALRRGLIRHDGRGPDSTSYVQAISESRLHDKWAEVLYELTRALLSPADAAEAVVRGFLSDGDGAAVAALNGVDREQFTVMVNLAGDAPSPTQLSEALRRGIIPLDSGDPGKPGFTEGIRQGRLANKWTQMIRDLSKVWPTPTDALEARLVGQVTTDESKALYEKFGGDGQFFDLLFSTRGESPTPLELITLANRGFIDWDGLGSDKTTYAQGFHEGRWRNKWQPIYRKLAEYVPPESTVVTLLGHGAIDDKQAAKLLSQQGMSQELVTAYIKNAHIDALTDYRGATVSMVLQAYHGQMISEKDAEHILGALHVTPTAAKFMIEYEDMQRAFAGVNSAMSRIRSLYSARKITLKTARSSLHELGIQADQVDDIIRSWQLENSIAVKTLSEAQIADAFMADILTYAEALVELSNIGYTPFDSWVLLSVKAKQALPDKPPQGPAPLQDTVTPGTT
jgi:hypothetical protein